MLVAPTEPKEPPRRTPHPSPTGCTGPSTSGPSRRTNPPSSGPTRTST